ncbi:MAG: non-homologous end-joining DNA ligase [Acidimicrobiales bacterium]
MPGPPPAIAPMRAVIGPLPTDDEGWAYEVKWDGVRVVATIEGGRVGLRSSNGNDITTRYPELAALADLLAGHAAVLDGEVVAFGEEGRPSFGRLQRRMHADPSRAPHLLAEVPIVFVAFDLLWLDGTDATPLPYAQRRRLLEALVPDGAHWQVPTAWQGNGAELLAAVEARGLEGLVAKRVDAPYEPGRRSAAWRKLKVRRQQELVVGGITPGEGGRASAFGALVLGYHDPPLATGPTGAVGPVAPDDRGPGPLRFAGKVGTGFDAAELDRLLALLGPLAIEACPFDPPPPSALVRGARWVRPEVVVEVAFTEWSHEGHLRHPAYLGQLDDRPASAVGREPDPPTAPPPGRRR